MLDDCPVGSAPCVLNLRSRSQAPSTTSTVTVVCLIPRALVTTMAGHARRSCRVLKAAGKPDVLQVSLTVALHVPLSHLAVRVTAVSGLQIRYPFGLRLAFVLVAVEVIGLMSPDCLCLLHL